MIPAIKPIKPVQPIKPVDPRDGQRLNHHLAIADKMANAHLVQTTHTAFELAYRLALASFDCEV
jgi:hypothetical protein